MIPDVHPTTCEDCKHWVPFEDAEAGRCLHPEHGGTTDAWATCRNAYPKLLLKKTPREYRQ